MDVTAHERPFRFRVDVAPLRKADAPDGERWIRMLASHLDPAFPQADREKERVWPFATSEGAGMHLAWHLANGQFTDEHDIRVRNAQGKIVNLIPAAKIGEPRPLPGAESALTMTEVGPEITGILYEGDASHEPACMCDGCRADRWWFLLQTLERSGARRRVKASVDGRVLHRTEAPDGTKDVWESYVEDIALTLKPMNSGTWVEIAKSMLAWRDLDLAATRMAKARIEEGVAVAESLADGGRLARYAKADGQITDQAALQYLVDGGVEQARAHELVGRIFAADAQPGAAH